MHGIPPYAWVHIFWWCRLVESSSWLAIPPACSPGHIPLPPSAPRCCKLLSRRSPWSKLQRTLSFSINSTSTCMCIRYILLSYCTWIKRFWGIMELWWAALVLNRWWNQVPQIWDQNQCIATRPMVDCFDSVDKTNASEKGFIGRLGCMHQSESPSRYWEISTAVLRQAKRKYLLGPCLNSEPELLEVT